jgi:predicted regulator of Ras-like GTPase activity (Roadblock/LC7/MglB family)
MQQLIDDMKAIPGVIGACTYCSQNGIIDNNLPSLFKHDRLDNTAKHLAKVHAAGRLNFPDLTEVMICYEESVVVFRQINQDNHLITICDPGINMNLLGMSLNLAIENIPPEPEVINPPQSAEKTDAPVPDINTLLNKGPTAKPLQTMQQLLAKVIGPMAKIVFEDAVIRWAPDSTLKKGSLSKLLEVICQEIGDKEKSGEYRDLVRQKMASRSKSRDQAS